MKVKLTETFIRENLVCPPDRRRVEYVDAQQGLGLYVEVRATSEGQGTYYIRYRDPETGKTAHKRIGSTTDMDLATARERAKVMRGQVMQGIDPRGDRKSNKSMPTFSAFFEEQYLPNVKSRIRSWKKLEGIYRNFLKPAIGHKRLDQITWQELQALHTRARDEGKAPASADHVLKTARAALGKAVAWDILEKNPASRVPLFNVDNRVVRYLSKEEMARLVQTLARDSNRPVSLVAMYLLSTGARLNEALQATWDQIDRERRIWRIPASNSKSKKVRFVPLNQTALDVLDETGTEGKHDHIFVSQKTKSRLKYVHRTWSRIRRDCELPDLRIHDLRKQFSSILLNNKRSIAEIGTILGHSDFKVTERYLVVSHQSLHSAADTAAEAITEALNYGCESQAEIKGHEGEEKAA